ncbi:SdrD B-like domain-containing protein, partial [Tessaracoccus sp. OH4464_COT-324]|uniref:SdrD B-like domain-containing protein n=1 Tax=Tessaracoccus sp. OH4464_COT-324 TaxID=2491059 RepID=UPI000FBBCC9C
MSHKVGRAWLALALAVSLIFSTLLGVASANAAPNQRIVVKITELVRVGSTGEVVPGKLRDQNGARIRFTYDASAANPQPGDSFSIGLPEEFDLYENKTVELRYNNMVAGECQLANRSVTCTFNDTIRGHTNISGEGELTFRVNKTTDAKTVTFDLNGTKTAVPLPGGGGIDTSLGPFRQMAPTKWIGTILEKHNHIRWEIIFNPSKLPDDHEGKPNAVRQVVWKDKLTAGQVFVPKKRVPQEGNPGVIVPYELVLLNQRNGGYERLATTEGPLSTKYGTFGLKFDFNDPARPTEATITATGPFNPDHNYLIRYYAKFDSATGNPIPGLEYKNRATLQGTASETFVTASGRYVDTFKVTITMEKGFGGFEVLKLLGGEAANDVAVGTKFTTSVAWKLPDGKSAADYPGWNAPANPVPLEVTLGKTTTYPATFPVGTEITLTEDTSSANPASPVTWGDPKFTVDRKTTAKSATFVIKDQVSVPVQIQNIAERAKEKVSVGDYVWFDVNADGIQDDTDKPIPGVTLTLTGPNGQQVTDVYGNEVAPVQTGPDGRYSFDNLPALSPGQKYTVTVTPPAGAKPTTAGATDRAKDSSTGFAESEGLTEDGQRDETLDFGFVKPSVSVGDYVWFDVNKDGRQDDTDRPIADVTLTLTGPDGQPVTDVYGDPVAPTTTDARGHYTFDNLPVLAAGQKYKVTVSNPKGYIPTTPGQGDRAKDSSTGFAESEGLTQDGQRDETLDFGFVRPSVSVGDYVFIDTNHDGVQNDGDKPLKGVTLTLTGPDGQPVTDVNGQPVAPTQTDDQGHYSFDHLPVLAAGQKYKVTVTAPEGYIPTKPGVGARDKDSS